jgi:nucleoside-diphosphate-sugar epimerase
MRLLVLGGTRFVGRAIVDDALSRGWEVDALSRGQTGSLPDGARHLVGDREDADDLRRALGNGSWDLVVDTWAMAPKVVATAVDALRDRTGRYGYVSSESVYVEGRPPGGDESAPVVDADPRAERTDYAADKRGGELAVLEAFPDAVLGRAGMILGPHENVGRLPWWLTRIAAGGRVVAPGRPDRPIQYVDVRDLAAWLLDALTSGFTGPCDLVCPSGFVTTRSLLEASVAATGSDAELVWVPQDAVLAAGAEPWIQLPCWVPEDAEFDGFMEGDTSRAVASGLRSRGIEKTARDTWEWLQRQPMTDFRGHGLPPELESQLLATVEA